MTIKFIQTKTFNKTVTYITVIYFLITVIIFI
jgi:hypothetical protein